MRETWVLSLGQEDSLEESMATHSSVFAWRIPGMGEPGGLPSMGPSTVWSGSADRGRLAWGSLDRKLALRALLFDFKEICSSSCFLKSFY